MFSDDKEKDLDIKRKLLDNTVSVSLRIEFTDGKTTINDDKIMLDTLELTSSICDEGELTFGGCISSQLTVSVFNVSDDLTNREIKVYITQDYINDLYPSDSLYASDNLYLGEQKQVDVCIFTGTVISCKRQQNRDIKDITAYDNFYLASKINIYPWFYNLAYHTPNADIKSLKETIIDICEEKGLVIDSGSLYGIDDNYKLSLSDALVEDIYNGELSAMDLLKDYCECSARFAICNGNGEIKFISLPQENDTENVYEVGYYKDLTFEDYEVVKISKARFPYNKSKKSTEIIYTKSGKQNYYDSDNKLTACNTDKSIVGNLIKPANAPYAGWLFYGFVPFSADLFDRWWIEPGDTITLNTNDNDIPQITSTIFNRTINGTVGLNVQVSTDSAEYQGDEEKE